MIYSSICVRYVGKRGSRVVTQLKSTKSCPISPLKQFIASKHDQHQKRKQLF